jgi:predicted PurR-regulated permease PerM
MDAIFGSFAAIIYISLIVLSILVPIFVFLISKRVKEMRDLAREFSPTIKELNANIKYLKRKFDENINAKSD